MVKDTDGGPAAGVIFQVFRGRINVDDDITPIRLGNPSSDRKDNDGDGKIDEADEDFVGYATAADGRLQLDLADGLYTLVGFSVKQHFLLVEEVSVPNSVVISATDAVPVSVSCRAADGSPITGAEVFFRPTKRARASVGYSDNSGSLRAYVSDGEYNIVLWAATGGGPHYLVLPHQAISPPGAEVNLHVSEIPTGELHFDLPAGVAIATLEVLDSTYTYEYAEGEESEIGYDTHYTDFYTLISTEHPYTLSAGIDYNLSLSFVVIFGTEIVYAYELWSAIRPVQQGVQRIGITENDSFALHILADRWDEEPIYHPGDRVNLHYYFIDSRGNQLSRILNFSGARLIFPKVTVWDPYGVPIKSNFSEENFFGFSFDLSASAPSGEYRAEVTLDAGMYGRIVGDLQFHVRPIPDSEPPQIASLEFPTELEAGQNLVVTATISDNVGLAENPKLRFSVDAGVSWTETPMAPAGGDLYSAVVSWDFLAQKISLNPPFPEGDFAVGDLSWQITAQDLAGNRVQRSGVMNVMDTSPPTIAHELLATAELGRELWIRADVRDNVAINETVLFYTGKSANVRSVEMSGTRAIYSASIPGSEVTFDRVSYYIRATDTVGNVAFLPAGPDAPQFADVTVKDTTAPAVSHNPVSFAIANTPLRIEAIITDNSGTVEARFFYRSTQEPNYRSISMHNRRELYSAEIPAEAVVPDGVQYHIIASDGIDPDGNVRSSVSPADGDHAVEVRAVPYGALAHLEISPSAAQDAPLNVAAGGSVRFTAVGRGEAGELLPADVTWRAIGGIGHIDQDGLFLAAGHIPGDGVGGIVATARYTDIQGKILQVEAWVRIYPGPPVHIILIPNSLSIAAGDDQRFFATLTDVYSNTVPGEIEWRVDAQEQMGTIDDGIFSATKVGSGYVVAEVNDIQAISYVAVRPGPLRKIAISLPAHGQKVAAGDTMRFTAEGYDAFGNYISIAPTWSVHDGIGTISGDGLFRGGAAGIGQVVAAVGDVSTAVDVEVVTGQLHSISVSPYAAYLPVSTDEHPSTQQFVADGWDIAGNPVPLKSISWEIYDLSGTISPSGLFTATSSRGARLGEIVINGTIWARGTSAAGRQAAGPGYVVIQRSPASRLTTTSVFVQGTSSDLTVVPLATGESVQFEAVGRDVEGRSLSIDPLWSVEGGIGYIDASGRFTAAKPGSGAVVITAGGFTSRAQVEVTPGSLSSVAISPDMLVLSPGAQHSLTALGYDSFGNLAPIHDAHWSVEGDAVTIEPAGADCLVTARKAQDTRLEIQDIRQQEDAASLESWALSLGSSSSIVSVRTGDVVGFANIFVSSASISPARDTSMALGDHGNRPYYLEIEPDLINVAAGSHQQFAARAIDVLGNEFDSGSLSWSVAGGIGEIDGSGLFRAGNELGSCRVIVTDGWTIGTAVVTVSATAQAEELLIIPSRASLPAGAMQKLNAFVRSNGELIPIVPAWRVIGNVGTIDAAGRLLAITAGEGEVEAAAGGLWARCRVTVSPGEPARIEIQPSSLSIRAGEQRKFSVMCRDEAGNLVDSSPVFQLVGDLGEIDASGFFTAQKAGAGSVMVGLWANGLMDSYAYECIFGEAKVEVLAGSLAEIVIPAQAGIHVRAGNSVRFSAVAKDGYGNIIPVDPTWDILGPAEMGSISSNGLFIADRVGRGQIRAKAGGVMSTASVAVSPAAPAFILVEPALISVSSQATDAKQFSSTFLDPRGNVVEEAVVADLSWAVTEGMGSVDPQTGLFVNEVGLSETRTGHVTAAAVINRGTELERTIRGKAVVILYPDVKPLATITVTPDPALVIRGDTQRYTAVGRDADGFEVEVHAIWSVVSDDRDLEVPNAISADGSFSSTPEMEVGSSWRVLASALSNEDRVIRGEARLTLTTGPLQYVEVVCGDSSRVAECEEGKRIRASVPAPEDVCTVPIESGIMVEIEAVGYDQFRNQVGISPDWRVTGEIGTLQMSTGKGDRVALAAGRVGSGEVIAEAEGKEGKVHITVVPGPLVDIMVSTDPAPADGSLGASEANPLILEAGSDMYFVAHGRDSDVDSLGRAKYMNLVDVSPVWSVKPLDEATDLGSISANGRFTGREAGIGRIEAKVGSVIGFFHIQVIAGDLASIRVSPSSVSIASGSEERQQFSASGYDLYGNQIADIAKPIWRVTGNIGDIDENGLFTPVSLAQGSPAISGTVVASIETRHAVSLEGSSSVSIVSALGKLSALSVTVEPPVVQAGGQAICAVSGTDEFGNPVDLLTYGPIDLSVSVPARLGTVSQSDAPNEWIFRAGRNLSPDANQRSGLLTVTAKADDTTLSDDALLTVIPGPLSRISVEPAESTLSAGEEKNFKAFGYDSWANQTELLTTEWTISPVLGRVVQDTDHPQEAVFTATTAGQGHLIVRSQGYEGQADLTVLPGQLKTLAVEPEALTIAAGSSHRFVGAGKDQYGNEIQDLKLNWQVMGDVSIGSATQDGLFSAVKVGRGKLKATYTHANGVVSSGEADITVVAGSIASADIVVYKDGKLTMLEPPFVFLSGVQYDLHIRGTDSWGNQVSSLEGVAWSVAEDIGLIAPSESTSAAVLTALFPGRGQIAATVEGISTHADVEVVPHSQDVSSRRGAKVLGPLQASIDIPPGALRTDAEISIALAPSPHIQGDATEMRAQQIGYVYDFQPHGMVFTVPAELTLSFSSVTISEIDDERLSLYSWDSFQRTWVRVGGLVNSYQKSVTATVNYLSLFAIMQDDLDPLSTQYEGVYLLDIRLSPNTYFAPEIVPLTIHYNIGCAPGRPVAVTIKIHDIRGRLVRELLDKSPKYPGWNTDQWDGTNEAGEIVKNGRYFMLITAETDSNKVSKTKHLAVFK